MSIIKDSLGVSRVLNFGDSLPYIHTLFKAGRPVLDSELNLMQELQSYQRGLLQKSFIGDLTFIERSELTIEVSNPGYLKHKGVSRFVWGDYILSIPEFLVLLGQAERTKKYTHVILDINITEVSGNTVVKGGLVGNAGIADVINDTDFGMATATRLMPSISLRKVSSDDYNISSSSSSVLLCTIMNKGELSPTNVTGAGAISEYSITGFKVSDIINYSKGDLITLINSDKVAQITIDPITNAQDFYIIVENKVIGKVLAVSRPMSLFIMSLLNTNLGEFNLDSNLYIAKVTGGIGYNNSIRNISNVVDRRVLADRNISDVDINLLKGGITSLCMGNTFEPIKDFNLLSKELYSPIGITNILYLPFDEKVGVSEDYFTSNILSTPYFESFSESRGVTYTRFSNTGIGYDSRIAFTLGSSVVGELYDTSGALANVRLQKATLMFYILPTAVEGDSLLFTAYLDSVLSGCMPCLYINKNVLKCKATSGSIFEYILPEEITHIRIDYSKNKYLRFWINGKREFTIDSVVMSKLVFDDTSPVSSLSIPKVVVGSPGVGLAKFSLSMGVEDSLSSDWFSKIGNTDSLGVIRALDLLQMSGSSDISSYGYYEYNYDYYGTGGSSNGGCLPIKISTITGDVSDNFGSLMTVLDPKTNKYVYQINLAGYVIESVLEVYVVGSDDNCILVPSSSITFDKKKVYIPIISTALSLSLLPNSKFLIKLRLTPLSGSVDPCYAKDTQVMLGSGVGFDKYTKYLPIPFGSVSYDALKYTHEGQLYKKFDVVNPIISPDVVAVAGKNIYLGLPKYISCSVPILDFMYMNSVNLVVMLSSSTLPTVRVVGISTASSKGVLVENVGINLYKATITLSKDIRNIPISNLGGSDAMLLTITDGVQVLSAMYEYSNTDCIYKNGQVAIEQLLDGRLHLLSVDGFNSVTPIKIVSPKLSSSNIHSETQYYGEDFLILDKSCTGYEMSCSPTSQGVLYGMGINIDDGVDSLYHVSVKLDLLSSNVKRVRFTDKSYIGPLPEFNLSEESDSKVFIYPMLCRRVSTGEDFRVFLVSQDKKFLTVKNFQVFVLPVGGIR